MKLVVASVLLVINLAAFLTYGWDKWRARRGGRRVPEAWLLGLALPLGFPGAWLGARVFHHKTRKRSFRLRFAAVVLLNVVAIGFALWIWARA